MCRKKSGKVNSYSEGAVCWVFISLCVVFGGRCSLANQKHLKSIQQLMGALQSLVVTKDDQGGRVDKGCCVVHVVKKRNTLPGKVLRQNCTWPLPSQRGGVGPFPTWKWFGVESEGTYVLFVAGLHPVLMIFKRGNRARNKLQYSWVAYIQRHVIYMYSQNTRKINYLLHSKGWYTNKIHKYIYIYIFVGVL